MWISDYFQSKFEFVFRKCVGGAWPVMPFKTFLGATEPLRAEIWAIESGRRPCALVACLSSDLKNFFPRFPKKSFSLPENSSFEIFHPHSRYCQELRETEFAGIFYSSHISWNQSLFEVMIFSCFYL